MADETVWKLQIQEGNSITVLKNLDFMLISVKQRFDSVAVVATKAATNFKATSNSTADLASKATSASAGFDKLSTLQVKASESAKRLEVVQAQAALALKKADDAANSGKVSAEQLAAAQARAALAAEKIKVAENAVGMAMQKAATESKQLSEAMQETSSKATALSGLTDQAKKSLTSMGEKAKGVATIGIMAVTAALAAAGAAIVGSIPKAGDFEETMNLIGSSSNISREEIAKLSDTLLKMGPDVRKGPQDLASALYYITGAGYGSSQAMDILQKSAREAAAGLTSTQIVANAATAVLKTFPALSTAQAFDIMTASVNMGKTEWKDYAPAIGEVALFAQQAGVSFQEATSALSTLTNVMPSTEQASTSLTALLQTSSRFSELTDRASKLGLAFDTNSYKSMNLIDRLRYLQEITHGDTEAMNSLLGQEEAFPAITALLNDGAKDYIKNLDGITHSAGAADAAFKRTGEGAKASWAKASAAAESLQIKMGLALLPVIDLFSERIVPLVAGMTDWVTKSGVLERAVAGIASALQNSQGIFIAIGAIVGGLLVGAFAALAVSVVAATWPFLLAGVAIAGLIGGFVLLYNNVAPFRDAMNSLGTAMQNVWGVISSNFMPVMNTLGGILAQVGAFLLTSFKPVWDQLIATFQTQLVPAWNDFMAALQPALPLFRLIGAVIGGALLANLGIVIATIGGLIRAIAGMLPGVFQAFGGIVQMVSGVVQAILGVVDFFVDLFTGKFDKLGGDLRHILDGIKTHFAGLWNVIAGIFNAALGAITGYFTGFFQTLDGLTGGAISRFIGRITSFFQSLWNNIIGGAQAGGAALSSWWSDLWNGFLHIPAVAGIIQFFQDAWNFIYSTGQAALGRLPAIFDGVSQKAQQTASAVSNWFQDAWKRIETFWQQLPLAGAFSAVADTFGKLGPVVQKTLQDQLAPLSKIFSQIGETFRSQLAGALSGIMPALANLGNSFTLIWNRIVQAAQFVGAIFTAMWQPLYQAIAPLIPIIGGTLLTAIQALWSSLVMIGNFVGGTFAITWKALWESLVMIGNFVGSALASAWQALSPILAQIWQLIGGQLLGSLQAIGIVIGGVILIAIASFLGAIVGLANGIATFIQGVTLTITGIIQIFSGIVQIISGIVALIIDICTGNFGKLGADLGIIWQGIVTMFTGLWNVIKGIFTASIGAIASFIYSFISTIIQFFLNLYNSLVGHSIIPDLVNGIISFFSILPNFFVNIGQGMWNGIKQGINWIIDGINSFIKFMNGIHISIPAVTVGPVHTPGADFGLPQIPFIPHLASGVKNFVGGLALLGEQGPELAYLQRGSNVLNATDTARLRSGADPNTQYLAQMVSLLAQIVTLQQQQKGNVTNNNIQASPVDAAKLNQMMQSLSGWSYESVARGGF